MEVAYLDYNKYKDIKLGKFYHPAIYFNRDKRHTLRIFKRAQDAVDYGKALAKRYKSIFGDCHE